MDFEEQAGELFIGNPGRIECDAHGFGMAGTAAAYLFVVGVRSAAARVAGHSFAHAGRFAEGILHTPETASGEQGHARAAVGGRRGRTRRIRGVGVGCRLAGTKGQREGIDAMPRVFRRKMFAFKNMSQMAAARGADDFDARAVGIGTTFHRARNFVVKAGPAAARVEFVRGPIQGRAAPAAYIGARFVQVPVSARKGPFRIFVPNDAIFFRRQGGHGGGAHDCRLEGNRRGVVSRVGGHGRCRARAERDQKKNKNARAGKEVHAERVRSPLCSARIDGVSRKIILTTNMRNKELRPRPVPGAPEAWLAAAPRTVPEST